MSYLRYMCLFGSSLPPVVCRRAHVLFIYVICVCLVCLYLQLFVGGLMSYLHYLCLFGSTLPPVVCRRAYICVCLVCLYLQLFVGGLMSYLPYMCLFGSVVCRRAHVLFTLYVFVWFVFTSSCL